MRRAFLILAALIALPAAASRGGGAVYDLSIAGVPIGEARLEARREGARYALEASADVGFLFWGGVGQARTEGAAGVSLTPSAYRLTYQGATTPGRVEIDFDGARAVRWDREPPIPPEYAEGRVAVAPDHLGDVLDPLSALVIAAPADAAPDQLCRRVLPVFSGYTRFDLALTGAASVGPDGAVACSVAYRPVSGHRADSAGVRRVSAPGAVSIALAPLVDGLWGPQRIAVATRFGTFEALRR